MLHAVSAAVVETHLPLLWSCPCETRCHSVVAFFVEIQIFEVLYALYLVCDTSGGKKSFMQIVKCNGLLNAEDKWLH